MIRVERIQTLDGVLHLTVDAAKRHAEAKYADALFRLSHNALSITKLTPMLEFLDGNGEAFATLRALKADIDLLTDGGT